MSIHIEVEIAVGQQKTANCKVDVPINIIGVTCAEGVENEADQKKITQFMANTTRDIVAANMTTAAVSSATTSTSKVTTDKLEAECKAACEKALDLDTRECSVCHEELMGPCS